MRRKHQSVFVSWSNGVLCLTEPAPATSCSGHLAVIRSSVSVTWAIARDSGLEMIRTLQDRGVHLGIDVYMECAITRLLKDGDRVAGAFGYWREQGRFVVFKAKSVVLATGGIGKAWRITSNSWEYTGDGMALAYDAGAELQDMEFVQFHPTGMVWPPGVQGILVTEAVRVEGGILRNKLGERF